MKYFVTKQNKQLFRYNKKKRCNTNELIYNTNEKSYHRNEFI